MFTSSELEMPFSAVSDGIKGALVSAGVSSLGAAEKELSEKISGVSSKLKSDSTGISAKMSSIFKVFSDFERDGFSTSLKN